VSAPSVIELSEVPREELERNLQSLMGPWGQVGVYPVESMCVRRIALAVKAEDPIHFDHDSAVARGYRGIVAPWAFIWTITHNLMEGEMGFIYGRATLHAADAYEFFEPMVVGDLISLETTNIGSEIKQGRAGLLAFVVTERRFTNQRGELCAILRTSTVRK
jgi:N-terminal half of MaoC dehydratase